MTLFKKKQINFSSNPFLEFLIVSIPLISILVILRIFSRMIFGDVWIGSLGLISVVLGMILFLSKKEKLGVFGRMFIRQIIKNYKGKRKWAMYFQVILFLSIGISTVFSIHVGNTEHQILKEQVIEEFRLQGIVIDSDLNYDAMQKISSQITPRQQIESIAALPMLTIQDFGIFSVILAVTDQLLGGWVMYFWQIVLIESVEILVFIGITRKYLLKNKLKN